jgi:glycosyltransferase involved in cell wall biosynthesis
MFYPGDFMQLHNPSNTTVRRKNAAIDRDQWHNPLVSIVVTHFNYAEFLADAVASLLDQTYENWECVVVDDASTPEHLSAVREIIDELGSPKVRLLPLAENLGQIPAFYAGLNATKGEFVCLLDPDDRYAQTFLEEMVAAHQNPIRYGALVSCEQYLLRNNQVITGVQTAHMARIKLDGRAPGETIGSDLRFISAETPGWHWSTTSGMMFRRPALEAMRPHRELGYRGDADAYLAPGAHMLGGSMFLSKP